MGQGKPVERTPMKYWIKYLHAWSIIKRKQIINLFPSKEKRFTKFAIVCAPRSGSTWLHMLLNSHPQIFSYGEILRETYEANPPKQLPSIHEMVFHPSHSAIKAVGLKVFYEYETNEPFKKSFQEIVDDNTICILHVIREDKVAQFKSLKTAEASQQWSSGRSTNQHITIQINPAELEAYQNNLLAQEKHINELFQDHPILNVKYEDLLSHQEKTLESIQDFLRVKSKKLFSLLKKQS